jgi:UPF0755 protein
MGYLRSYLKTRRGRRRTALIAVAVLMAAWLIVRCTSHEHTTLIYIPDANATEQYRVLTLEGFKLDRGDLSTPLQPGWVRFLQDETIPTHGALVEALRNRPREKTRRVVMYGGDTIHLFAQKLSEQTRIPKGHLINAYYRFSPYADGGILAGYYQVPYRTTPTATMFYLVYRSEQAFRAIAAQHHIPYRVDTFRHYLTVASIIQKETWHTEEMGHIASVIYNRLQRNMKLQLDATLNYGPYAHTPVTPERIRTDESAFNTYKHTGLPPQPIGSVSRDALHAAMAPDASDDLYFVLTRKGWHDFSEIYAEHLEKIRKYRGTEGR